MRPEQVPDHPVIRQMERTGEVRDPVVHGFAWQPDNPLDGTVHPWFGVGPLPAGAIKALARSANEILRGGKANGSTSDGRQTE